MRVLKIIKDKNKLMTYLTDFIKIKRGMERLVGFLVLFVLSLHLTACFILVVGSMYIETKCENNNCYVDNSNTWIGQWTPNSTVADNSQWLYTLAFYWAS